MWNTLSILILLRAAAYSSPNPCKSFASSISVQDSTIISVSSHTNGELIPLPGISETCYSPSANATSDMCRVVMAVDTTATSSVHMEIWLPSNWNGRFLTVGNGGMGGCVDFANLQYATQFGFAAVGTNAGHNGSGGYEALLNKPEVLNDLGYRAVHVGATTGKLVLQQFYGRAADRNYYIGCSTGGRQGFSTAMLYPDDFDGMLLGAPGVNWLRVVASKGILARRSGWPHVNSSAYIRAEQWDMIVKTQIKLFDAFDGVTDGIIDNPSQFSFDPETVACSSSQGMLSGSLCLVPEQVNAVRRTYEPIANTAGQIIYPSFEVGVSPEQFTKTRGNEDVRLAYSTLQDFWSGAVYNDSNWSSFDFNETDLDFAIKINPGRINTDATDLSAYYTRGGKIISYHGRSDALNTAANSMRLFANVQQTLGATLEEMHSFYRFFYIPGMEHCVQGLGAWNIGQTFPLRPDKNDTSHNALLSLVDWVENGAAPTSIIGTKNQNDSSLQPILAERTHCVYPNVSIWDGASITTEASSWQCRYPSVLL